MGKTSEHNLKNIQKSSHQTSLKALCRICARRSKNLRKISDKFRIDVQNHCNIDIIRDNKFEHPQSICTACYTIFHKKIHEDKDFPSDFEVFEFPEVPISRRSSGTCPDNCSVCKEKLRPGFQGTFGIKKKKGRPKSLPLEDRSPIGTICSRCGDKVINILNHKCLCKREAIKNFENRLKKNNIEDSVVARAIRGKTKLTNIHGTSKEIPLGHRETCTPEEGLNLSVRAGGTAGLRRVTQREFMSFLKLKNVKTPSEHKMKDMINQRCKDLFAEEEGKQKYENQRRMWKSTSGLEKRRNWEPGSDQMLKFESKFFGVGQISELVLGVWLKKRVIFWGFLKNIESKF